MWDNGDIYRTIGAKSGRGVLNIVFTQDDSSTPQFHKGGRQLLENEKIYAKISTINSINFDSPFSVIGYVDDGLSIGNTTFRLRINTIHGESVEAILRIVVTNKWNEITLEKID